MSTQEKIEGFSRLMIVDQNPYTEKCDFEPSGIWISKNRDWLIAPTSGRVSYQLIPISQASGIKMFSVYTNNPIGTLEKVIEAYHKLVDRPVVASTLDI